MNPLKRFLPVILILAAVSAFVLVLDSSREAIGRPFPGYLSFKNGVVGAYYVPDWTGPARGVSYHDLRPVESASSVPVFSVRDYFLIVLVPAVSGLLFSLLGLLVSAFLPPGPGRIPLLVFHSLAGLYLILSPDFHLSYQFVHAHLAVFAFLPAAMLHFSLLFPEESPKLKRRPALAVLPYAASLVLLVPYLLLFETEPRLWIVSEYAVVAYVLSAYLFWVVRLVRTIRRPQFEFNGLIARYLLRGQLIAFTVPFLAAVAVFAAGLSLPLNFAAPLTLLFPASLFVGIVLARLQQGQMRLVQTEKMATLGTLMSGLAHELKNPLNFVIANLDALKERAKTPDIREIVDDVEEGAERMRSILEDFRFFSGPERKEKAHVDLNEVVRHSANLLRPICGDRVSVALLLEEIPKVMGDAGALGRAVLNVMANAVESIDGEGEVFVTTGRRDRGVFLSIRDTGCGIPAENLNRIFDPFFTSKPQGQGTGLGLALTERIVREHGGTIEVRSEVGKGTEIAILFV